MGDAQRQNARRVRVGLAKHERYVRRAMTSQAPAAARQVRTREGALLVCLRNLVQDEFPKSYIK